MDTIKRFISEHKVLVILFVALFILRVFYTPWVTEDLEAEVVEEYSGEYAKPVQWAYTYFYSGFSDLLELGVYAIMITTKGDNNGGLVSFYLAMALFSVQKLADRKITEYESDNFMARYLRSNVIFFLSTYATYFLSPLIEKIMVMMGDWFVGILFVALFIMVPAGSFMFVYGICFWLSPVVLNHVLEAINFPLIAEYALAAIVVIAIAMLTDWLANKAFDLMLTFSSDFFERYILFWR